MKFLAALLLLFIISVSASAQMSVKDSVIFAPLINFTYAVQFPAGDLSERFGVNSSLGGSVLIKTNKNWLFGVDGRFLFGNVVKDTTMLDAIKTEQGFVIDQNGLFSDIRLFERGFMFSGKIGKLFPLFGPNPNSGLLVLGGVGLLQHKIRIEVETNSAPQLRGDYVKGYDRLTNGLALSQFVGYQHLGNRRMINFFIGVEFIEAFTQSRRDYDFDTMKKDDEKRNDLLFGIRVGWTLPLYKKAPKEFYFH